MMRRGRGAAAAALGGTQFGPDGELRPIEDPAHIGKRRKAVGLGTMAEYR